MNYRSLRISILLVVFSAGLSAVVSAQTGLCATDIGNPLPDLIVDAARLRSDVLLSVENFSDTQCARREGCVSSAGTHLLLRFSSSTPNVGEGDLVIGDPNECPGLFRLSECHNHLHFHEYADYRLWTSSGYDSWRLNRNMSEPTNTGSNAAFLAAAERNGDLILGRKQGFCIIDIERYSSDAATSRRYTLCGGPGQTGNQGLQVGWTDIYGQWLDCQFVQIDGLKTGTYVLEDHVNPEQLLPEADYTNNSSAVRFDFIQSGGRKKAQIRRVVIVP